MAVALTLRLPPSTSRRLADNPVAANLQLQVLAKFLQHGLTQKLGIEFACEIDERIRRLQAELELAEKELPTREKQIDRSIPLSTARYNITRLILGGSFIYAALVGLFIMAFDDPSRTTLLIEILKSLFLPIVTLVLGFYFGSKAE